MQETILSIGEITEALEKNYGLKAIDGKPVRRAYKVQTDQGVKGLLHAPPENRLRFLDSVIKHARNNGFNNMAGLNQTKEGQFGLEINTQKLFLMDWIEGQESDLNEDKQLVAASIMYAQFHNAGQGVPVKLDRWNNLGQWPENFRRRVKDLQKVKQLVIKKNNPDQYDILVKNEIDYFLDQANIAIDMLAQSPYAKMVEAAKKNPHVIHHSCYNHNLIFNPDGTMYLVDYGKMILDLPIHDIANFLIRHIRHQHWSKERAELILKTYNTVRQITEEEKILLKILLVFPQKFWKVAHKHYLSKKSEGHIGDSIRRVIREQDDKKLFVEAYDSLKY